MERPITPLWMTEPSRERSIAQRYPSYRHFVPSYETVIQSEGLRDGIEGAKDLVEVRLLAIVQNLMNSIINAFHLLVSNMVAKQNYSV